MGLWGGVGALELSTEAWGSEPRGGDMGEEAGEERKGRGVRGKGEVGSGPDSAAVTVPEVPSIPPVLEAWPVFAYLSGWVSHDPRSGSMSYL